MRARRAWAIAALLLLASCAGEIETPGEALRIFGDSLPPAYLGESYEAQVRAVGGLRPFTFGLEEGELPPGLELTAGVISGVPTETGTFDFTIAVSDANLSRTFQDYSLEVIERPPPVLSVVAPQTEVRSPVTVRLRVENATALRAFTTVVSWNADDFALQEGSVGSAVRGAASVWRDGEGTLHLEMAALGEPWNGELTLAQFTLVPDGPVVLRPTLETLFITDSGGTHYQGRSPDTAEEDATEEQQGDGEADSNAEPTDGEADATGERSDGEAGAAGEQPEDASGDEAGDGTGEEPDATDELPDDDAGEGNGDPAGEGTP